LKVRCELWVRLKVVDLVTQTAWITLTEKLEYGENLKGLSHYSFWGMELEGASVDEVARDVDRVIQMDSTFTNQNKHLYRLLAMDAEKFHSARENAGGNNAAIASFLPGRDDIFSLGTLVIEKDYPKLESSPGGAFSFDCLIRPVLRERELPYMNRLNERLKKAQVTNERLKKAQVTDIVAGEVWRITLLADDLKSARDEIESMVVTRSRRKGLLLNPHYQRYEIISIAGG